jgi:hypothetical protein
LTPWTLIAHRAGWLLRYPCRGFDDSTRDGMEYKIRRVRSVTRSQLLTFWTAEGI